MILLDGLDEALVGYTDEGEDAAAVYDMGKLVSIFMNRDDMSYHEALEWIDFNIMGLNAPIVFIQTGTREEIDDRFSAAIH